MPELTAALPPVAATALLLDLDGTLLDIALRPDAVVVPPSLPADLLRLRARLGDALAVVSGRPVEQIDALLPGVPFAVAGEHGAAVRHHPGDPVQRASLPSAPAGWIEEAARIVAAHPGTRMEPKAHGFVLHYREAPEAGPALRAAIAPLVAAVPGQFVLMAARKAWEVKPRGVDKGVAVSALMQRPPFCGRRPVFIGDDVTDEDGMRVARSFGGSGLKVQDVFGTPAGVRAWLAAASAQDGPLWPVPSLA